MVARPGSSSQLLQPREREIIKMVFGIGCQEMTLEEIGDKFGLTRERVRQIIIIHLPEVQTERIR